MIATWPKIMLYADTIAFQPEVAIRRKVVRLAPTSPRTLKPHATENGGTSHRQYRRVANLAANAQDCVGMLSIDSSRGTDGVSGLALPR